MESWKLIIPWSDLEVQTYQSWQKNTNIVDCTGQPAMNKYAQRFWRNWLAKGTKNHNFLRGFGLPTFPLPIFTH